MKIGYFGGTFDPVHNGHLALAREVLRACALDQIIFVPTDVPPHKRAASVTPYIHRYTMVALALAESGERRFAPSLLEQPAAGKRRPRYSLNTVRALRRNLHATDKLFFVVGSDAFSDIAHWHRPVELLRSCEFIVASRPGFPLERVVDALPGPLRPRMLVQRAPRRRASQPTLLLPGVTIHLVESVHHPASATVIRAAIGKHQSTWRRMLPRSVAQYIQTMRLYEGE